MTLMEAMQSQPYWLQMWLNVLFLGGFVLPVALLFWRDTRLAAIWLLVAALLSVLGVGWMYSQMGYVKLLGLPHILFWTPTAIYLFAVLRRDIPTPPRILGNVILAVILVSLAFDYTDAIRWILGERTPLALPATQMPEAG